jgi:hypothetical protein
MKLVTATTALLPLSGLAAALDEAFAPLPAVAA